MSHQATTSIGNFQDIKQAFDELHSTVETMVMHRYGNADEITMQAYLTVFQRKCSIFMILSTKQEYLDAPGYQRFLRPQLEGVRQRVRVEEMDVESIPATSKGKKKDMGLGIDIDVVRPVVEGPRDVRIQEEKVVVKAEELPWSSRRKCTIKSMEYIEESDKEDELQLPAAPPKPKKVTKGESSKSAHADRKALPLETKPTAVTTAAVDDQGVLEPTRKLHEHPALEPQVGLFRVDVEQVIAGGSCFRCKTRGWKCLVCYEKPYDQPQQAVKKLSDKHARPYKKVACHQCQSHKDKCEWSTAFMLSTVAGRGYSEAPAVEVKEKKQVAMAVAAVKLTIMVHLQLSPPTGNVVAGPSRTSHSSAAPTITIPPPHNHKHPHIATIQEDLVTPPHISALVKPPPLTPIELPPIKPNINRTPPEHKLGGWMTMSRHKLPVQQSFSPVPPYVLTSSTTSETPYGFPL
ncbi:hypothetical protein BDZ97DRAFT_1917337 [Flammula alnicola]|nr:hypothetical protein BDZ97DRAFT_1917337 [Flammula alnicola]